MSTADPKGELGFVQAVFDDLGAGVYALDASGRVITVNPRAEQILGRSAAEMAGQDAHDLLHRHEDGTMTSREECRVLMVMADGRPAEGSDEFYLRGDGTTVPVIWAAAPLRLEGGPPGVVVVLHDFSARKAAEEQTAVYLAALESLTGRLSLMAETSAVLLPTLEIPEVLRRLTRLLVPELADWSVAAILIGRTDEVRRVAVHSGDSGDSGVAGALLGPLPPLSGASRSALARVLHGSGPVLLSSDDLAGEPDSALAAAHKDLFDRLGGHSAIVVPLRTRRQVFGALTVARTGDSPPYTDAETMVLADIGRRAGLVLDNAQLFDQQRHVAETLQRQLLTPLPQVGDLRMAARYRPAEAAAEIGGDWYDAFQLADGATTLVIGDVVGHDLQAAAHMAEVRNMLRALAWDRQEPPGLIMRRLDEAMTNTSDAPMATVIFARLEGEEGCPWRLHWTNAGHPPPLLVTSDGRTRYLEGGHGPLLGLGAVADLDLSWPDAHEPLPPESTLLLYTDGLVESRSRPIDAGMARLRRHAGLLARREVEDFCDQLLERLDPGGDDVALLALRLPPAADRS